MDEEINILKARIVELEKNVESIFKMLIAINKVFVKLFDAVKVLSDYLPKLRVIPRFTRDSVESKPMQPLANS